MIHRKYFVICFLFILGTYILFVSCQPVVNEMPVRANSMNPQGNESITFEPTKKTNIIEAESTQIDEKNVVIYFLIDKSGSINDFCSDENNRRSAKDIIPMLKTFVRALDSYGKSQNGQNLNLSIGVSKFSSNTTILLDITDISELTGTQISDFEGDMDEIFEDLEQDHTYINKAVNDVKQLMEEYDPDTDSKKIIVLVTDGEMSFELFQDLEIHSSLEFYQYINQFNSESEIDLFYGLYPGTKQEAYINEASLIINDYALPRDVFQWPKTLFSSIYINPKTFGWVNEQVDESIYIDECKVNKFYSYPDTQDDEVNLYVSMDNSDHEETIKSGEYVPVLYRDPDNIYRIYTKSTLGFYWIEAYRPEMEISIEPPQILITYLGRNEGTLNIALENLEDVYYRENISKYKYCINVDTPYGWNSSELNKINDLSFPVNIILPKDTCNLSEYKSKLYISSVGGEELLSLDYDVNLLYEPEIIDYPTMHSDNIENIEVETVYKLYLNTFMYSEPKVYLFRPKKIESADVTPPPCLAGRTYTDEYEYLLIKNDNLISEDIPVEEDPRFAAMYTINPLYSDNCVTEIELWAYEEFISSTSENGYSNLLLVWENELDPNTQDTAIACDINPDSFADFKTIMNCHKDNSLIP